MANTRPLVQGPEIRLAMLGMVDGNGHPYSWSAIFNGYDPEAMATCPFPAIPDYLSRQPKHTFGIPGARVTHVWTDEPKDARHVSKCSLVPNVVERPEDVVGQVDAAIIATDKGHEHVRRCEPFVEAGLPLFVDKPLVDRAADLAIFRAWVAAGKPIMSCSSMRYAKEYMPYRASTHDLGELRFASITTPKSWERYGIHALEAIYPILGPGFLTARNSGTAERNIVHFKHRCGADAVAVATADLYGGFGLLTLAGTKGSVQVAYRDSFHAFKAQLEAFTEYLRTGETPFPFAETDELMRMIIGGIVSRENGGAEISLDNIGQA